MATGYHGFSEERSGYENDPRWSQVDEYTSTHLHQDSRLNNALNSATANSDKHGLPPISVSEHQGKFLMLMARTKGAKHILELGLLGGYSTIWLANASPDVRITTIEVSAQNAKVAAENLERAGVRERVEIIVGSGADILPRLIAEVRSKQREAYDFFFIDADKDSNPFYVDCAVQLAVSKALIVTDNVVRRARLVTHADVPPNPANRKMVEDVGKDERLDGTVIQLVGDKNYDGFLIAVVN